MNEIAVDRTATASRLAELRRYMDEHVTDGVRFVCRHEHACRSSLADSLAFARGQLSYVGPNYDVSIGGEPYRILVIAMDTGRPDELVDLEARRTQVYKRVQQQFSRRNPHMRGTTSALRLLFGRSPGADPDGDWLHLAEGRTHVL